MYNLKTSPLVEKQEKSNYICRMFQKVGAEIQEYAILIKTSEKLWQYICLNINIPFMEYLDS